MDKIKNKNKKLIAYLLDSIIPFIISDSIWFYLILSEMAYMYDSDMDTDTESNYDTESMSDSDSEYEYEEEYEYEPEEQSRTKNNIVICQAYQDMDIDGYELVHLRLKKFEYPQIHAMYRTIMCQRPACKLEIAECVYLPSGHCIAILKTFWIRIIQRA